MRTIGIAVLACLVLIGAVAVGAAIATPGAGIAAGPIVARGVAGQQIVLGVPGTSNVTRTVRVRVGKKVITKRVSFAVETV